MTEQNRPLEKGTSLWTDARKRLLKNKAAVAGGLVVAFMAVIALAFPLLSAHVTRFTFDENHAFYSFPRPMFSRSVPNTHARLDQDTAPEVLDQNGDRKISAEELSSYLERNEFSHWDRDDSGFIDAVELSQAPIVLLLNPETDDHDAEYTLNEHDTNRDGKLDFGETVAAYRTLIYDLDEAANFLRKNDANEDREISFDEFPGIPQPQVHYFGTDGLGRDLLTRVIMGARISLLVGFIATAVSVLIGVLWGATAGFLGGKVDNVMMRFVDVMYGLPFMFLVILLMVIFQEFDADKKLILLFVALGAVQWLTMSRIVRGQVITLKNREFVEAARATGVSKRTIILRHLIPNALGPIIVYSTLTVPAVMLEEAFLSFLGLGVQAPRASWGSLATDGAAAFQTSPWLIIFPGGALALTLLSLNFLGDGLRDALDPQSRKD